MQPVILGGNGVINQLPEEGFPRPAEWRPIRGSLEAIARLHRAEWRIIVASNQPELGGGTLSPEELARMHEVMRRHVVESGGVIDAIFFCPHAPASGCSCHLPAPGLLHDIAARLHVNLAGLPVIGDSLAYVQAAQAAGARPLLVKTGRGFGTVSQPSLDPSVPVFNDLFSAVDFLLHPTAHTTGP
ncbi:MAG: HAD-IIIA family hydrolase [Gammaproteobacteria bacterium]